MLELFVSGSGKNSGKTFVTAGLAATMQSLGYSSCVYKPIQTGAVIRDGYLESPDLTFVKFIDPYVKTYFTYLLQNPAIPLISAEMENIRINIDEIYQDYKSLNFECVLVDGTFGLATPLTEKFLEQDLVKKLDIPALLVVSPNENSVNNTLANINQAISFGVKIRGVIINDCSKIIQDINIKSMPKLIEKYTDTKILGVMPQMENLDQINSNDLITNVLTGIDIEKVFDIKIAKLEL
ncbi:dethiobiotin synthase [bacterium]|nr:dethiobiotin synthase [bacterium]